LIDFDLSLIPNNAVILSANLSLYSYDSPANQSHSSQSGSNESVLKRITSSWDENSVTWNNQPSTTETNQVFLQQSSASIQDYLDINVSNLIQDMIDNPNEGFGLQLSLKEEAFYRKMIFASSDNGDESLHPKLEITFIESVTADTCITFQPSSLDGKDAYIDSRLNANNYGEHPDFPSLAWTNGGTEVIGRGLIDFDLSQIPANAIILSANLSLYSYDSPANQSHSSQSGSNESVLKRITSSWEENLVTWNNQPSTTETNQVFLQQSSASIQNYLNINVSNLIKDMIDNPSESFGLQLSLKEEEFYRKMIFASSDNTNATLHPKLEICYTIETSNSNLNEKENCNFDLFPNPAHNSISLNFAKCLEGQNYTLEILNTKGQSLQTKTNLDFPSSQLDISNYPKGIYYIKLKINDQFSIKKLIIQ